MFWLLKLLIPQVMTEVWWNEQETLTWPKILTTKTRQGCQKMSAEEPTGKQYMIFQNSNVFFLVFEVDICWDKKSQGKKYHCFGDGASTFLCTLMLGEKNKFMKLWVSACIFNN